MQSLKIACAAALLAFGASDAAAQQMQTVKYKVGAENSKYTQRQNIDVGDAPGHTVGIFEIHRTFPGDAPVISGAKLKETWTRGYSDYVTNNNGLSTNYTTYVLDNGDRFTTHSSTMGHADANGRRTTVGVGKIISGTGKLAGMRGMVRTNGVSDGKKGFNETSTEIEYWIAK
jgi:hypothetical protein